MENKFKTVDFYKQKVGRSQYIIAIIAIMSAIIASVMSLATGQFASTPRIWFGVFIGVALMEIIAFIFVYRQLFVNKEFRLEKYNTLKIAVTILCLVNYTFIVFLMPSQMMWTAFVFFLIIIGLFIDFKLIIGSSIAFVAIIIVFFATHSIESLQNVAVQDEMLTRFLLISLGGTGIIFNGYFLGYILANVGQDLMDKNTQKLSDVISKVNQLMEKLEDASSNLVCISEEENASIEEIASVTTSIVSDTTNIVEKTGESKNKLVLLKQKVENITKEMKKMDEISKNIAKVSVTNEKALTNVQGISEIINQSTTNTLTVTSKLQNKVQEIDKLLQLIENIAEETNLLALNASIEAARAGEEGKGFAVVAEQVKKLSENTSNSLQNVQVVIKEFKQDTEEVEKLMSTNVEQVDRQGKLIDQTVDAIKDMIKMLDASAEQVRHVEKLTDQQYAYTDETVVFNDEVKVCIEEQVSRIEDISELIDQNRIAIEQITLQVEALNSIVGDIQQVLA